MLRASALGQRSRHELGSASGREATEADGLAVLDKRRGFVSRHTWERHYGSNRTRDPKTPFHGGITIDTAPYACAWHARRMTGRASVVCR